MPQQTRPVNLQVARGNLLHRLSIQAHAVYGGNLPFPGRRRRPRHGGHLQDGKRGECPFSVFRSSRLQAIAIPM